MPRYQHADTPAELTPEDLDRTDESVEVLGGELGGCISVLIPRHINIFISATSSE